MNIRELAKEAGVSVATISRVINHPEAVLPETRERVQAIIEKHNYDPKPVNRNKRFVSLIVPAAARAGRLDAGRAHRRTGLRAGTHVPGVLRL